MSSPPLISDTIAALSTPSGTGAIAVLRVSGPQSKAVAETVFKGPALKPRTALFGKLTAADGTVIDEVLLTFFQEPASYTGEDTLEISCHGGVLVSRRVLERLLQAGARAAGPGEFTQRAFLNGKLDLTQAEAVMDVISAQTDRALHSARRQLDGVLGRTVLDLRDDLLGILAHVEAYIDFPEEDIDPDTGEALKGRISRLQARMEALLATADQGRLLREGVRTVLAGAPNAGKSSLLNRLLGFERAIVSDRPGTTRDTIEEVISLQGFPLRLVDTAGLRGHTEDGIEQAGMDRTRAQMAEADLIVEVVDAGQPPGPPLSLAEGMEEKWVRVLHKSDLPAHPGWLGAEGVRVSSVTGEGLTDLTDRLIQIITLGGAAFEQTEVAVNARHQAALESARTALGAALAEFQAGASAEFVALDLRLALEALGGIVGRVDTEDLLGVIFSQFCIGK
ncbi:MAG: tRNA uridine-5-carboxymethylaminomethyl(34) synthesis GTPase MnmE [Verrucomicrobiaceae bacterium]|nr:MAG: tRNA uridine-5-carboxymethylaminomethyl(34) synthesis GTPase MnmE [Verrucomicrobiaceae bacterium]